MAYFDDAKIEYTEVPQDDHWASKTVALQEARDAIPPAELSPMANPSALRVSRPDWSQQLVPGATIEHLDAHAISIAREKYIAGEIDALTDAEFLTRLKLLHSGHVTNAAMLLLGNAAYEPLMESPPVIVWRWIEAAGTIGSYKIFHMPFVTAAEDVFRCIRNSTYRYLPDPEALFTEFIDRYDVWSFYELLYNSIAHADYVLGNRIYVHEEERRITISNPGTFLPKRMETVLDPSYKPPYYRNRLLAETMSKLGMMDGMTRGIRQVCRVQRDRYFPLPDYSFQNHQVKVTLYGAVLDNHYTHALFTHPNLDLKTVYWLDQIQKGRGDALSKDAVVSLGEQGFVQLHSYLHVSGSTTDSPSAIFDARDAQKQIVAYLLQHGKASRGDINKLLWDQMPKDMDHAAKSKKIASILSAMRRKHVIIRQTSDTELPVWVLVEQK